MLASALSVLTTSLHSPIALSRSHSSTTADSSLVRRSSISLGKQRARPYTVPSRPTNSDGHSSAMAAAPFDQTWNTSPVVKTARQSFAHQRRPSDASTSYTLGNALGTFTPSSDPVDLRPGSSHSSVRSMGDAGSSHSHKSGSASPNNVGAAHATYDVNMHHASPLSAPWPSPSDLVTATQANYPAMPGPYTNPNAPFEAYETGASYRQVSPDSMTPSHFPTTLFPETFTTGGRQMTGQVPSSSYATPYTPNSTSPSPQSLETENRLLRKRLRDMEALYRQSEEQLRSFTGGMQLAQASLHPSVSTSQHTSPPPSPTFQASWNARTEARIRLFCSLNRAGNALCAWHDSRRERRAYPPRNAPPGVLNCGCTYEEALFEESLARHNVGSYHPGESVRMDPALRNPLLRLLQDRYGYRDGDFERASQNGRWVGDEGPAIWEQKVHAGVRGKTRPERNPSAS